MANNAWITHVKEWAAAHNVSYGCAISKPECKAAYAYKKIPKRTTNPLREIAKARKGFAEVKNQLLEKYPAYAEKKAGDRETAIMGSEDINRTSVGGRRTGVFRMITDRMISAKNPLKGRVARGLYVANEDARDSLARLKLAKAGRGKPAVTMVGMSPRQFK